MGAAPKTVTPDDLADTLVRRFRLEREQADSQARQIRRLLHAWAGQARAKGLIHQAWLIGSLAWGEFGRRSDVDVVVEGLDPEREGQVWADLVSRLQAKVDLLSLESLPEAFAKRVREEGVRLE